jgi:anti-sigma B factor antagonist
MSIWFEEKDYFLIARCDLLSLESCNARAFKEEVTSAIGESHRALIVDLSTVREIDSSGLGALVAVLKWVRRFGGSMRISGVSAPVREVVELTMLHRILPLHDTVEEAMDQEAAGIV